MPKQTDIHAALTLLSTEVRDEITRIRGEGADAMTGGDYDTAESVIAFAKDLDDFAAEVERLAGKWDTITDRHEEEPEVVQKIVGTKLFKGRARKGTTTPEEDYIIPLLRALEELGGEAKTADVIARVGEKMKSKLKEPDLLPLPSPPHMIRWENKTMWTRNTLVNTLGYMRNDTPRGIWAISDKGRNWLARQK